MSKYKAFTLIELLVTVTIIGILSSIAIYGLTTIRQKATDTSTLSKLQDTQLSLAAYKSVTGKYPDSLSALVPTYTPKVQADSAWKYSISSDKKTYCIYISSINKPESQPDLKTTCPNTWMACQGTQATTFGNCQNPQ